MLFVNQAVNYFITSTLATLHFYSKKTEFVQKVMEYLLTIQE